MKSTIIRPPLSLIAAAVLGLSGCGGSNFKPEAVSAATATPTLAVPTIEDQLASRGQATIIGPGDRLDFKVLGLPELDRSVRVETDGTIGLPLVGTVRAAGVPIAQLREEITRRLGDRYLQDPQVTLELGESVNQRFVIDGGVKLPGIYAVIGNQTLMQSVAQAQGLADYARADEVVVFRTVNGIRHVAVFNLNDIRGARAPDPEIYPNDRIIVGNNSNAPLLRDLLALSPVIGLFYQVVN